VGGEGRNRYDADVSAPIAIARYVQGFTSSPLGRWSAWTPWALTSAATAVVRELLTELGGQDFLTTGDVAIHRTATIETGAVLKGPLVVGAHCFIAAGAYLRGGNWLAEGCTIGPGAELKSSFVFAGSSLAHFNFVGDSILGADVNLEAGSIVCNHRNERANREIVVREGGSPHHTGVEKFGALVGDRTRIGANAVIAPGTLLHPATVVARGASLDQDVAERGS
jgi:UDP-N-acetylglucosamine diphosphorylase / glucose-1-phosphate thymidylyltransferase / UDP-N-acetylgalactosamine diphosphorylase / glucosamine-1-phosphate N-acetyltransferase / galactosamine-1-phosphate N-acetyltransferase